VADIGHVGSSPFPIGPDGFGLRPNHIFADGRMLAIDVTFSAPRPGPEPPPFERSRAERDLYAVTAAGEVTGLAMRVATGDFYQHRVDRFINSGPMPFGRMPVRAAGADLLYYGEAERYEIGAYSPDGTLMRVVRLAHRATVVGPEDVRRFRDGVLDDMSPEYRDMQEQTLDAIPYPETYPPYDQLVVDHMGRL
jgi:hypothetical protein